jgi:hypothetical protein
MWEATRVGQYLRIWLLCLVIQACVGVSASDVTVCDVTANPAKYDETTVVISASVSSDGMHSIAFRDSKCESKYLFLLGAASERGKKALRDLQDAIFEGHPGTDDKKVEAVVAGVIRLRPNEEPDYGFFLDELQSLRVRKR